MKVLVTGIAGRMGRLVAERLVAQGHKVVGIDVRAWPAAPQGIWVHQVDIRKRPAEDVFRRFRPDGAIHLATVTHLGETSDDRYRINLEGTRAFFEYAHRHGAQRAVFVGRHTYYGAAPDAPLYHKEDEPPMVMHHFPELADLVASDLYAGSALWRFPELDTSVLRVCYTLGPAAHGTLARFLSPRRVPTVLGFDPLFQFMHERDVAAAIVTSLEHGLRGVYNVAGPAPLPLSLIIDLAGKRRVPVPEPLFTFALKRLRITPLPKGAIEHLKYPIVVDSRPFRETTGFRYEYDADETIAAFREGS